MNDVLGVCGYCSRPAARTCAACGVPMCEAHASIDMPAWCFQCAHGRSHAATSHVPDEAVADAAVHELERVRD